MAAIVLLVIFVLSCAILFAIFRLKANNRFLVDTFSNGNVIVAGRKRKGKDVLFAHVINLRKKDHFSNIHYDFNCNNFKSSVIHLLKLECGGNSFNNLITDNVQKFTPELEQKKDIYVSDAGIYLPAHEDSTLSKIYKGMPLTYALSGHLYESNIHCNTQRFKRLWVKLREQADYYILVKTNIKLPNLCIFLKLYCYENEDTAISERRPFKGRFLSSDRRKVAKEEYEANNGLVSGRWVCVPWKTLSHYDTHELRKAFFTDRYNQSMGFYPLSEYSEVSENDRIDQTTE